MLYLPTKGVYPFTGDPKTHCAKHYENPCFLQKQRAVRGNAPPPSGAPPSLGTPAVDREATTDTQRAVVISTRSASRFAKTGLVLEKGEHFQQACVSHIGTKTQAPFGALTATFKATTNNVVARRD